MMGQDLLRLVYTSRASNRCGPEALAEILNQARAHNPTVNITGQLLFEQGLFAQWLEGPASAVQNVWSKLQRDPRHGTIQLISVCPIEERCFPQWSMAVTAAQRDAISHVQGFVNQRVAELPAILSFPDQILGLFDLLADVQSLNRPRQSSRD
jgi:Sensors of blue-light using FAD